MSLGALRARRLEVRPESVGASPHPVHPIGLVDRPVRVGGEVHHPEVHTQGSGRVVSRWVFRLDDQREVERAVSVHEVGLASKSSAGHRLPSVLRPPDPELVAAIEREQGHALPPLALPRQDARVVGNGARGAGRSASGTGSRT